MSILKSSTDRVLGVSMVVLALLVVLIIWSVSSFLNLNYKVEEKVTLSEKRSDAIYLVSTTINQRENELIRSVLEDDIEIVEKLTDASLRTNLVLEKAIQDLSDQLPNEEQIKELKFLNNEITVEHEGLITLAKQNLDDLAREKINSRISEVTKIKSMVFELIKQEQQYSQILLREFGYREYSTLVVIFLVVTASIGILISVVTRLRQATRELDRLNVGLEEQVVQRTKELEESFEDLTENVFALEQTQAKLVESEKMASLGVLVKGVVFELDDPIGLSNGAANEMKKELKTFERHFTNDELSSVKFEHFFSVSESCVEIVQENLAQSLKLIHCFKKIAMENDDIHEDAVMVSELVEEIAASHGLSLQKNVEIEVECQSGISAFVIKDALLDVINNLIENAVYHSSEKKLKQVVEVGTEVVGTDICITIKDQGKGIQQDELEKIFDPFNMTQKGKGRSGLGLSVVYNLVTQILEGKIRCLSEPGHGTMFEVTFPYKPAI